MNLSAATTVLLLFCAIGISARGSEAMRLTTLHHPFFPSLSTRAGISADPVRHFPFRRIMDDFEEALETALELAGEAPAAEKKLTKDSTDLSLRPTFALRETNDGYVMNCFTPGLKKEDLYIELIGASQDRVPMLVIRGETKVREAMNPEGADTVTDPNVKKQTSSFLRARYRKFEKEMSLPMDVDQDKMEAVYEDGMLTINLPRKGKPPPASPMRIEIK